MIKPNWTLIRAKLKEALLVLPNFFKNPVQGMRNLPEWDWPTMLLLQGGFAAACAFLANLLERNLLYMITGLVIAPLANYLLVAIFSGLFYYTFLFLYKREIPYRQIYQHVIFAAIPLMLVSIVASFLPPLFIVGAAAALLLLFIGFVDNFQLEPLKVRKLLGALMGLYLIFWVVQMIQFTSHQESRRQRATPESLDILERELKSDR